MKNRRWWFCAGFWAAFFLGIWIVLGLTPVGFNLGERFTYWVWLPSAIMGYLCWIAGAAVADRMVGSGR